MTNVRTEDSAQSRAKRIYRAVERRGVERITSLAAKGEIRHEQVFDVFGFLDSTPLFQ